MLLSTFLKKETQSELISLMCIPSKPHTHINYRPRIVPEIFTGILKNTYTLGVSKLESEMIAHKSLGTNYKDYRYMRVIFRQIRQLIKHNKALSKT